MRPGRLQLKTYSHLLPLKRVPNEYDIGSTSLLYYPGRGFEVNVPLSSWYERYQKGSPLQSADWEKFRDPRETTYASYTALQSRREAYVDGVLQSIEDSKSDQKLSARALELNNSILAPLRYPVHGLQMLAAYVGQMAPSGRITIAALFQASDEMRRIQRLAYRLALLRQTHEAIGRDERQAWQTGAAWQPLRECIERLMATFDWGEAFVALNVCLKPMLDALFGTELALAAREAGEPLWAEVLQSLMGDCRWHREWTASLVQMLTAERVENQAAIQRWVDLWYPVARRAILAVSPLISSASDEVSARVDDQGRAFLQEVSLERPACA